MAGGAQRGGRPSPGRRRAGAALALLALGMAAPPPEAETVPLDVIAPALQSTVAVARTARGLELDVDGSAMLGVPIPGVAELQLDGVVDGRLLVTWAAHTGLGRAPARYRQVGPGPVSLRMDMLQTGRWEPASAPVLVLEGAGHLTIAALRVRMAPQDLAGLAGALDRATRWAPESVGQTTINHLSPVKWSASRGLYLEDVVGLAAAALFAGMLAGAWALRRRPRPARALAASGLAAVALANAHFMFRAAPAANLSFEPDPEVRIARNYYFAPDVGTVSALARAALPVSDRVLVLGAPADWFAPQTICFILAPRRCAFGAPGPGPWTGISGVGSLRLDEADAIVSFRAGAPLPPGFARVASIGENVFLARRP